MAPMSLAMNPAQARWEARRWSSARTTRMYWARLGTSIPASFSTART